MEPDAIFDDPSFTIPFEFYQGFDIISVADPQNAAKGQLDGNLFEHQTLPRCQDEQAEI